MFCFVLIEIGSHYAVLANHELWSARIKGVCLHAWIVFFIHVFKKAVLIYSVYMNVSISCVCVCVPCLCLEIRAKCVVPGTGVTGGSESLCGFWELNSGLLN